ncbi:helix-turn-helix domain-containing protein [Romboutsia weinsteinii]|nr:helix-turn-helix transcriptional regulator [Romboutsia weinsteinii]
MDFNAEVGLRIFNTRKKHKLSRAELGKKVNLHETTVKRYEDGHIKSLDVEKLKEFAQALDLDPAELIGLKNDAEGASSFYPVNLKEQKLLKHFNKLNENGKDEAIQRIMELTLVPRYSSHQVETIAAHNDFTSQPNELSKINEDIEDMKNWE